LDKRQAKRTERGTKNLSNKLFRNGTGGGEKKWAKWSSQLIRCWKVKIKTRQEERK